MKLEARSFILRKTHHYLVPILKPYWPEQKSWDKSQFHVADESVVCGSHSSNFNNTMSGNIYPAEKTLQIMTISKDPNLITSPTNTISLDHLEPGEVRDQLKSQGYVACALGYDATSAFEVNRSLAWKNYKRGGLLESKRGALLSDITTESVEIMAAQGVASHVYTMTSVALFLGKDLIIWTECPMDEVKLAFGTTFFKTGKMWFDGNIKKRSFIGLKNEEFYFGLSPQFQAANFVSDHELRKWGIDLEDRIPPWSGDGRPIKMLTLKLDKVLSMPYNQNLRAAIDDTYKPRYLNDDPGNYGSTPIDVRFRVLAHIYKGDAAWERFGDDYHEGNWLDYEEEMRQQPFWRETEILDINHKED